MLVAVFGRHREIGDLRIKGKYKGSACIKGARLHTDGLNVYPVDSKESLAGCDIIDFQHGEHESVLPDLYKRAIRKARVLLNGAFVEAYYYTYDRWYAVYKVVPLNDYVSVRWE